MPVISKPVLGCEKSATDRLSHDTYINLQAPCVLYVGQAFLYSPENAFHIFDQQIYFII